ncbi:unnamed protein product [Cylicocyclus nassatus]|uniref:SET domain-containing protein n=1 Tax=Cylicocyclus nassatus TaxID=53992 RepID=A0AA36MDG8_CYLNA|nr:unnamed protein product [Cylicocyclus nassatus]
MLCFNPAIITVFVLLSESTHAVFYATKMDAVSTTGLPHLPELNQRIFHENGFHGEVIGFAAKREEECGIVLLDYGSYTNGDMFNHILEKLEDTLKDNNTLDQALRAKVFAAQKEQALKEHMEEMSKLFERYRSNTPHYNTAQVTFFGGLGLIAFGIGIGIGKLVYNGVTSLMRSFVKGEQLQHLDMELIAIYKKLDNLAKILEVQINKNRFESVFAHVRTQLVFAVQNSLNDLFTIARLMGEKRFNASMLKNRYFAAGNTLIATVISMNKHLMEVEVCYPITKEQDVGYLLRIVPLGKFSDDGETEDFTLVQPLLRTIVLATRLKIPEPVTVVEIPKGGVLYVGLAVVEARVTTDNLTIELQITLPVSNMSFEPIVGPDDNHDDGAAWYSYGCHLNSLLLATFSLLIALSSLSEFYERVERNKYALRAEMDVGMQRLEESVQEMGRRLELRDAMQREEEPGTSYAHIEEDALERDSSAIDMMEAESTSKSQAIQSYEASKAAKQGGPVEKVFKTAPNVELMFCYEMDDQAPGYYKEDYIVPKKQKNKWQGKVDVELKYYRKLDGRMHPLLREFEEYISEALPDALARKGNPLKNGTWGYVSCINRFMLAAMRARKRKFIDLRLEPVAGRERRDVLKHGKKLFLDYMAKLNVEEKQTLSFQGIVPSEKKKGEPYCVARAVVEHKGVEEAVEKIMKIFEQKGTLQPAQYNYVMGALWCYIIHCNTSRNECIYKMMYGSICRSEEEDVTSVNEWERTGLQEFVMDFGDEVEERLWISSYPLPKSRARAAQEKIPFYGQYFVLDEKSKKWMDYYIKLRNYIIRKQHLEGMTEPLAPFFLQYSGTRVHQMTVPHVMKQFLRDSGFGNLNLSCNTTRHAIADLQYENDYQQKIDEMAKVPGVDKECAHTTGHSQVTQLINYQKRYRYSCAYGYVKIRNFGRKEAAKYPELVREVKKKFKLANLERRKHLADLEEEDLEMDDFDEDDVVEEEGDEEEATRILLEEKGDEEEATRNLDVAGNKGDGQTEPILRADTRQRSSRPLTETESSPRKRPRVSLPVEDVPGEMQASSSSSLKQFDRPPTDNDEGLVQHIVIEDEDDHEEEEEEEKEKKISKLNFKITAKISEASAEPIMSDVTRATASETVHAIHDVADTTRYTISDLERRFEPLDPSLHLEALNETPYTGGLTKIATVPQQNQFLRRSHAQPVQDFPWLEVREMPTINGRGVYAKVDIAKEMAVADVRGYQGKVEDIRNSLKKLNEEERHKVIKYWHGFRRRGCDFILLAHCDSYKATVTLGRLINQSIEHANLVLRCIRFGERRVRWLHCLVAKRDIKAGEQLLWNYGRTERNPNIPNFPDNYPCICQVCDPAATEEEDLSLHERPEFDIGELLFLVTQKARAVGLLLEKTPAADPRVAFAISRRTVFTKSDVFPDPAMFLVKVASPLAQLLQIATEAAFEHMESVVLILYRKRNDPKPLVILLGSRHLEDDGHRYGCCVAVVGEEIYAVECQAEARADEMPLHLELLEAGPLTRHFPSLTIEPWETIRRKPKLTHEQIMQLLQNK